MTADDTIIAISSAVGPAARMIVRISGPAAIELAQQVGVPAGSTGGSAFHTKLSFAGLSVLAWVYLFRAPRSYTGEDLVEFHLPGNPVLAKMLLEALLRLGARAAEPGEFTARAYFNGRMDLTEAEGVAATIAAGNQQELAAARRLLSGELVRRLAPAMEVLTGTLALVEAGIDFVDEDVTFLSVEQVARRIEEIDSILQRLLAESTRFERLGHEPHVILVGRPNAGKSTLLNVLAGQQRAVVSRVAGTTRDALSAEVFLPCGAVRIIDVAGIDDLSPPGGSDIDRQMRQHALRAAESADVLVLVHDSTDARAPLVLPRNPMLTVASKADLLPIASREILEKDQTEACCGGADIPVIGGADIPKLGGADGVVAVSALTGAGMDELRHRLDAICFGDSSSGSDLALNVRHVAAITEARSALGRAGDQLHHGPELISFELRESLDHLGAVLGRVSPDDLLGRIFSSFCIGK